MSVKTCRLKTTNTAQQHKKLKIGQKRQKLLIHNENSLVRVFMTKQQNKIFWQKELFLTKTVIKRLKLLQTCLDMTKPPNSTKTESWSKQSKTDKNNWKPLESDSHYQQPIKKF